MVLSKKWVKTLLFIQLQKKEKIIILKYLQTTDSSMLKARDIAEGLFVSSRTVSGAMRKLVTDGFVEKVGESPVLYTLTEKGKEFKIED